jgi:hypothetical protein
VNTELERARKDAAVALLKVPSRGNKVDLKNVVQDNQSLDLGPKI